MSLVVTLALDFGIVLPLTVGVVVVAVFLLVINQYKRCPPDRVLVVFGMTGGDGAAKCTHGGGVFVVPLIQDFMYLSLEPHRIELNLPGLVTSDKKVDLAFSLTAAIGTEPRLMNNAAERLLGLPRDEIRMQAQDITKNVVGQAVAPLPANDICRDHPRLEDLIHSRLEPELNQIGMTIKTVGVVHADYTRG